jgi:hypothetical protein
MNVCCRCDNETRCAGCGEPLWERQINANYYDEPRGRVCHVPGFKEFDHECSSGLPVPAAANRARVSLARKTAHGATRKRNVGEARREAGVYVQ